MDELGYVPTSKVGAELLFEVISMAYERQSVMITMNLAVSMDHHRIDTIMGPQE